MAKVRILSCALASLAFASIVFSGCSDSGQGTSSQIEEQAEEQTQNYAGVNLLTSVFPSPKEKNPYSMENMNKTFKSLILANNPNAKDIPELEANFLYVRFLPYGKQGVHELKTYDTALVLFKHPMDYNEIRKPVVYMDKALPDSIIPYFASVPVGYEFGSTPYEILQELFLTQPLEEDDGDDQEGSRFVKAKKSNKTNKEVSAYLKGKGLVPSQLEAAAFPNSERFNAEDKSNSGRILGKNIPLDMDNIVAWSFWPSRWRPDGTLTFSDTAKINNIEKTEHPLVGVRVTAGYFYYWRESHTDSKGYFSSPERWTFSVDYEANFDSDQFLLEDGHSWYGEDLEIEKNNKKSAWKEKFTGNHAKWCVVWTAAYNYWYGEIYGLQRPRQNRWWNQSLDIWVYYKNDSDYNKDIGSSNGDYSYSPVTERIAIRAYNRNHIEIYGSTIHEIAHSSHYWNVRAIFGITIATYSLLPKKLKESYARGIQRYLSIKRYGDWSRASYDKEYTGIFEDLEDANSTYAKLNGAEKTCDRVSGITAPMAEKAVFNSFYWEHFFWSNFKENLMEYYPNGTTNEDGKKVSYTKADMDALFKYWETGDGTPCPVSNSSTAKPSSPNAVAGSLTDIRDKKVYKTATIGAQVWMAENLNYNASGSTCYSNYAANCATYGRLYDWATAMALPSSCNSASCSVKATHQGVCPSGWHIPSMEDWNKLMRYVDNVNNTRSPYDSPTAGIHLKATSGWSSGGNPGGSGRDTYGFSALPGGIGNPSGSGFSYLGYNGDWWSTAEYDGSSAYRFDLYYGDKAGWSDVGGTNRRFDKTSLYSIRCLKD